MYSHIFVCVSMYVYLCECMCVCVFHVCVSVYTHAYTCMEAGREFRLFPSTYYFETGALCKLGTCIFLGRLEASNPK